jgi:hypothetical protein
VTDRPGLNWSAAGKGPQAKPRKAWPRWATVLIVAGLAGGFDLAWFMLRPAEQQTAERDKPAPAAALAPAEPANLVAAESPQIAFDEAKTANTVQAWDEFLAKVDAGQVQGGPLTDQARQERAKLIAAQTTQPAFDAAKTANTIQAWDDFLAKADTGEVQRGPLVDQAHQERAKLVTAENTKAGFDQAKAANTVEAWDEFLAEVNAGTYQSGPLADRAKRERAKLVAAQNPQSAFDEAKTAGTVEAWDAYIAKVRAGEIAGGPLADRARRERGMLLTGQLQEELRRVGCDPGPSTSEWREGSRRALQNFNESAGTSLDVSAATPEALKAVQGQASRVCPLTCDRGLKAEGDKCVAIECNPDDPATCEKPAAQSQPLKQDDLQGHPQERPQQEHPRHRERAVQRHSPQKSQGKGGCMVFGVRKPC